MRYLLLLGLLLTYGLAAQPAPWAEKLVIYELNTRQFSFRGDLKSVVPRLSELKQMGVDVVWLMPIYPIGVKNRKGKLGSPYAVRDYRAVNPELGNLADFKAVIAAAHQAGLRIILDWVPNHTAWDHPWTVQHPEYYVRDSKGKFAPPVADWTDVIKLDYARPQMREAMIEALEFWVKLGVDGFRCDVAGLVPTDFWEQARPRLQSIRPIFMLAEAEKPELLRKAFDADYASEYFVIFGKIAHQQAQPASLHEQVESDRKRYPMGARRMLFSSNHDQNSWLDSDLKNLGQKPSEAFAKLTFCLPGLPLIYNGQEASNAKKLAFFERDPLAWDGASRRSLYQQWAQLYHEHPALYEGEYEVVNNNLPAQVLSFHRQAGPERLVVVANLSFQPASVLLDLNTRLHSLLDDTSVALDSALKPSLQLAPWQVVVLQVSR